jgi:hypothetical protein
VLCQQTCDRGSAASTGRIRLIEAWIVPVRDSLTRTWPVAQGRLEEYLTSYLRYPIG